jgi:hypothetical protein
VAVDGTATACPVESTSNISLSCTVPYVPAGVLTLRVMTATGYAVSDVVLSNTPQLTSVTPAVGSLAGGLEVTLQAFGAPFHTDNVAQNQVTVGGLPCEVQAVAEGELKCITGRAIGVVPTKVHLWPCRPC